MSAAPELDVFSCPLDGVRLVEASAGTGKTWNICGLYLRLLLERALPVESLLVVTFTKAATAELSGRIRERIVETLQVLDGGTPGPDPFVSNLLAHLAAAGHAREQLATRLRLALQTFDEAAIFTIHGFCQRALADTPFAAGLPYELELVEDDSALRLEATQDFWRREVAGGGLPALLATHLLQSGDSPEGWAEILKRHMSRPCARPLWDEGTAAEGTEADGGVGAALAADEARLQSAYAAARAVAGTLGEAIAAVEAALGGLNANSYKSESVAKAARQWADWLAAGDALHPLPGGNDGKLALLTADTLAAKTTAAGRKSGIAPPRHAFFDPAAELLAARSAVDTHCATARLRLLRRFVEHTTAELRRRKAEHRQIAFDDILWNAHRALHAGDQPWLAAALHARYPVALIDEFQDTDPLQFGIFDRIYRAEDRHGTLFLVGDPKQAIYSFRSADLFTYLAARDRTDTRYTLRHNQRSAPALIEACNRLFGANPAVFMMPGLEYVHVGAGSRQRTPLVDDTAPGPLPPLQLWRIPRDETLDEGDGRAGAAAGEGNDEGEGAEAGGGTRLPRAQVMHRAAHAAAAEIARLLAAGADGHIHIGDDALAPADIAVLVRSHGQGARMRRALAAFGVGSVELSQASVYHTDDAEELERVLLAIAEPLRERRVKAALATATMGRDAAALARLAADEAALLATLDAFARWRELWLTRGFGVMLRQWMSDEGVATRLLARADGERRLTNLMHLAELLQQDAGSAAPEVLLRTLASRRADARGGEATQLRLESDRNLVQIVTIHRAKGLEYGVVFCPFLFDGYARGGSDGPMRAWHDDDGELVLDYRAEAAADKAVKARIKYEQQAEDLRLIYVALTRAVHRCYLVVGSYASTSFGKINHTEAGRSLLNWMVAGAGMDAEAWAAHKPTPAGTDAHWRALVAASSLDGQPVMALADLPDGHGAALPAPDTASQRPRAQRPPQVPPGWRIGSFSALISGAVHERAAQDHDASALPAGEIRILAEPSEAPSPQPVPADDILRFPRGPSAGDCMHAMFEAADFTDAASWDVAIDGALAAHPQRLADEGRRVRSAAAGRQQEDEPAPVRLARMLRSLLADVLATPLLPAGAAGAGAAPLRLDSVPQDRRLVELGFHLPAPRLTAAQLNAWLAAQGYGVPRLAFSDLDGYLKGFIDLVFEHDGRFWILDWKSNHLGEQPEDYAPARMEAAMQAHGYHLQHLLYTVALHRHLGRSLAGYDYETHFGGVLYLFVRGVRPGWQLDGQPTGVFHHCCPAATLNALDALLSGQEIAIAEELA
ncbi:UvrD-helicase domain-containing protein [Thauera sp.]|jgi:exodeoxyribonuclease V beta subunit|uniref:UvrD-helicase domain-containing protein n=1 Tax=Thauera sp. TaxID=1905334 RepID=UPI002A36E8C1|nr:UvrD-helicase domain-containing protein [Thauera sp.]MDX9884670.1 UvrD-helicase domain-containing protein [Thauera sp.]